MGKPAYFVGPWDLNRGFPCIPPSPEDGTVVLVESVAKGRALPFHRQKLVLVLSALHHFADELRDAGYDVDLRNAPSYVEGIRAHVEARGSTAIVAMAPRRSILDSVALVLLILELRKRVRRRAGNAVASRPETFDIELARHPFQSKCRRKVNRREIQPLCDSRGPGAGDTCCGIVRTLG